MRAHACTHMTHKHTRRGSRAKLDGERDDASAWTASCALRRAKYACNLDEADDEKPSHECVCVCVYVFCLCAVCVCVRVDVREECAHASCMHHASCIMHHVCHACWPQCEILGDIFVRPSANTDLTSDTHTCVGPSTMVLCSLSRLCPAVRALDDIL